MVWLGSMILAPFVLGQEAMIKEGKAKLAENDVAGAIAVLEGASGQYPNSHEVKFLLAFALNKSGRTDDALRVALEARQFKSKHHPTRRLLVDLYLEKEAFAEAMAECEWLLKEKTKDATVRLKQAEAMIGLKQYEPASIELSKLKEKEPRNVQILGLLGDVYAKQNIRALAIPLYEEALKYDPNAVGVKLKLAKLYFKEQSYSEALKEYLEVLKLDSNNREANLNVGYIYFNAGKSNTQQYGYAIYYLQKYVALWPDDFLGFLYLGNCYHALRRYKDAVPVLERAAELDTTSRVEGALEKLAESYMAVGKYDRVIDTYRTVMNRHLTMDAKSYLRLGSAYRMEKDTGNTVQYFLKAVETDSSMTYALHDIGMMYASAKRYREAIPWFKKRIAAGPSDSSAAVSWLNLGLGQFYSASSKADSAAALASIQRSVELKPSSSNYWMALAQIAERTDSLDVARLAYVRVAGLDSSNSLAYFGLGSLALRSGRYDEAILALRKAIELDESNKYAHYSLARAYVRKKRNADARKHYQRYLELDPESPLAKDVKKELTRLK